MKTIYRCEQGSEEWFSLRRGLPTASMFAAVLAQGRGGNASRSRQDYLLKLAGEILTNHPMDRHDNVHMRRGRLLEDEARRAYAFLSDEEPEQVGFITNGRKGASPDSLIRANGMLEIKTKLPHLLIHQLLKNGIPSEHYAQCQGNIWIAEREWIDLALYWPGLPLATKRIYRDEGYIERLESAVDTFLDDLDRVVDYVRRLRGDIGAESCKLSRDLSRSLAFS